MRVDSSAASWSFSSKKNGQSEADAGFSGTGRKRPDWTSERHVTAITARHLYNVIPIPRKYLAAGTQECTPGSERGGMPVRKIRGKAVLCVGNDLVNLNLRCALLREHGWRVLSSGTGQDGITRFGQETVDVVVLDLDHDGSESALIAAEMKRLARLCPSLCWSGTRAPWLQVQRRRLTRWF